MGNLLAGDDAPAPPPAPAPVTSPSPAPPPPPAPAPAAHLPEGWEALYDDQGIILYAHSESQTTQ